MIDPRSLSKEQKQFLQQHYQLDVDRRSQYRRGDRTIYLVRPWFGVALAFALYWEKPSGSSVLPSGPAEFVAWGFVGFVLLVCIAQFIRTIEDIIASPEASEQSKARWSALFRAMIRRPSGRMKFSQCDFPASVIGVGVIALLTGRPILAIGWALAILLWFALLRWFDHLVRLELAKAGSGIRSEVPGANVFSWRYAVLSSLSLIFAFLVALAVALVLFLPAALRQ